MVDTIEIDFETHFEGGVDATDVVDVVSGLRSLLRIGYPATEGNAERFDLKLKSYRQGSAFFEFLSTAFAIIQPTFHSITPFLTWPNIQSFISAAFEISKHLKGDPPQNIHRVRDSQAVQVTNRDGEVKVFQGDQYFIQNLYLITEATAKISKPLKERRGRGAVRVNRQQITDFSSDQVKNFRAVSANDNISVSELDVTLRVMAPVLEGEGVWRFGLGRNRLTAKITDTEFLNAVHEGRETFRNGDLVKVRLRIAQELRGTRLSTQNYVDRVYGRDA